MIHTVTLVRRTKTGEDADGNDIYGTTETALPGCNWQPRTKRTFGAEDTSGRDQVIDGTVLFAPASADIRVTDAFRIRGDMYEVEGEPGLWEGGRLAHWQVALQRVTG